LAFSNHKILGVPTLNPEAAEELTPMERMRDLEQKEAKRAKARGI